jgi:hypothetical protein
MHYTDFNTDFSIAPNLRNVICVEDGSAFNVRCYQSSRLSLKNLTSDCFSLVMPLSIFTLALYWCAFVLFQQGNNESWD